MTADAAAPPFFFLILHRAVGDFRDAGPLMEQHKDWLQTQLAADRLLLTGIGETEDGPGPDAGFLIVRAADFDDARRIAQDDPLIRSGVRSCELLRITPMNGLIRVSLWGARGSLR